MTTSSPVTVYTSARARGFANAIVAGLAARTHFDSQTMDRRLLAQHVGTRSKAVVLLSRGDIAWDHTELSAIRDAILIGGLDSSASLIRGLAGGAQTAISAHLPFEALLDELHTALDPRDSRARRDNFALMRRIRIRAEEATRIDDLTDREFEILGLVYTGHNADTVARIAHVSLTTVRAHVRHILHKLDVHSQVEACAMLRRSGRGTRRDRLETQIGRY